MKHIKMKYGFTLIELLVVVIIIAVLSAVAVPMYKHAALKSRFSKVMPVAKSIVEAQEVYYLGKNIYAANDEKDLLDVSPSGATTIELATRDQEDKYNYVAASSPEVPGARYIMYQKHSRKFANTIQCEADTADEQALWLCEKGLGGQEIPGGSINTTQGKTYKTFLLEGDRGDDTFIPPCPEGATCNSDTGAVTGCRTGYYASEGSCAACPANSTCNSSTGAIISCTPGYYKSGGACVAQEIAKRNCTGGSESCQNKNYTRDIYCSGGAGWGIGTGGCSNSTFSGTGAHCSPDQSYVCSNTTYTGLQSYCGGSGNLGCAGSTFYGGSYCDAQRGSTCNDTKYVPNEKGFLGCCLRDNCPVGTPKCRTTTGYTAIWNETNQAYEQDGWWGECCNPTAVGGAENCGTTQPCA